MEKFLGTARTYVKELPESCSRCRNFYLQPYICHNERGLCGVCALGYIKDGRDFIGKSHFSGCQLKVKEE